MRARRTILCTILAVALAASSCGGGGAAGGSACPIEREGDEKVVQIGAIVPLNAGVVAFGVGIKKAAELAIEQANEANKIPGWRIQYCPQDDSSDPKIGTAAAQKLASDPSVAAVIGTYNSGVALAIQPILDAANIPLVSPGNTTPSLTLGAKWDTAPERPYDTYFRTVANDRDQGRVAARYAYEELDRRNAVVIHDKKTLGQAIANVFAERFKELGGEVAKVIEVNPGEGDYKTAVTDAKSEDPDIIFYGGEYPDAGPLTKNMAEIGMTAPDVILMGGDGIADPQFVKLAGEEAAQGHYATSVGATVEFVETSKKFVEDYVEKFDTEDYSLYGTTSYDATNIVINALAKVLEGKDQIDDTVRTDLIEAIQESKYTGASGTTSFDEFGDTTHRVLMINRVEGDNFKPLAPLTIED